MGRVFYAVVVGPGRESVRPTTAGIGVEAFQKSVQRELVSVLNNKTGPILVRALDNSPSVATQLERFARENSKIDFAATIRSLEPTTAEQVWTAIHSAVLNFDHSTVEVFRKFKLKPADFRLAIYETECLAPACSLPTFALKRVTPPRIDRYSKLEVWQRLNNIPRTQLTGVLQESPVTGLQHGPLTEVRHLPVAATTSKQRLDGFQRLANSIRTGSKAVAKGFELDSAAPTLLGLSQRSALALADILQSPVTALRQLPPGGPLELARVSDELARTRIVDCTRLRGNITPAAIGGCSGYLLDTATLAACTTNKLCFPPIGQGMVIDAVMIADLADLRSLAKGAAFPRISLAKDMDELRARVDACAAQPSVELRALCLAKKSVPKEQADTFDCAYRASTLKGKAQTEQLKGCVLASVPPEQRRALSCLESFRTQAVDSLLCLSEEKMSPQAKALAECVQAAPKNGRSRQNLATCYAAKQVAGAEAMMACLQKPGASWSSSVACAVGGQVEGDLGRALRCAQENSSSNAAAAVCMVKLPGDLGKAAACLAQANADPLGALICAAGDSGMTADQRIALQCAAQTGGEPASFTGCVVGQLTMKELALCKGKNFGEGNCFNENNEFRKIFSQAGIKIGPNSVVADVVNVHLRYMEAQVAIASDTIEAAKDAAEKIKATVDGAAKTMTVATRFVVQFQLDAFKAGGNVVKSACKSAVGWAGIKC